MFKFNKKFLIITGIFILILVIFVGCAIPSYAAEGSGIPSWSYLDNKTLTGYKTEYPYYIIEYDSMNSRYYFIGSKVPFVIKESSTDNRKIIAFFDKDASIKLRFTEGAKDWDKEDVISNVLLKEWTGDVNKNIVSASSDLKYGDKVFFSVGLKTLLTVMLGKVLHQMVPVLMVGLSVLSLMLLPRVLKKLLIFF